MSLLSWIRIRPYRFASVAILLWFSSFVPSRAAANCAGDCGGDEIVTVDELVQGVNIALGLDSISSCPAIDQGDEGVTVDDLVRAVTASLTGCPIFPADYRSSYTEVRDCRNSIEHGGVSIRVLTNEVATRPYLDGANPLPEGSVVIKEEFDGPDCEDDELVRWRVMRKEEPGFEIDGDWSWQWVDRGGRVVFNDKATCIVCHQEAECLARDYMCTHGKEGDLQLILEEQPGALLAVAGTSSTDVYAVGADPEDGSGPLVVHYDGARWQRLPTGASGDLWWISVTPIDGSFYMAGANGLILEYDLTERSFTQDETPPGDPTLFGIWGPSENDIWAVGADAKSAGVVWHFDGETWSVVDLSGVRKGGIPALNKVWGRSASEVYAVGATGIVLLFDGVSWSEVDSGTTRFLFTVHGNDDLVAASGGFISGLVIEKGTGAFEDRTPADALQANGVFIAPNGTGFAVGVQRSTILRSFGQWANHDSVPRDIRDYHGTWIDPDGGFWAVGGDLVDLERGILGYGGELVLPRVVEPVESSD